jgi:hypothetical protein
MVKNDIYTVAGNGMSGLSGNRGPATSAKLNVISSVAFDSAGNMLIPGLSGVRAVAGSTGTFYHQAMVKGDIYAIAGTPDRFSSGNGGKPLNAELSLPGPITVTPTGGYLFAESAQVRMVPAVSGTYFGRAMTAGNIYAVAGNDNAGSAGDGGPATSARVSFPGQLALDSAGNLVLTDGGNRVRVVAATSGTFYGQAMTAGDIYTVAGTGTAGSTGDGGPATAADIWGPEGLAIDGSGSVVFADSQNQRVRVVAAKSGTFYGQAMTAGDIYTIGGSGGDGGFSGDGGPATAAQLQFPLGVTTDHSGNLLLADTNNDRVRVVADATGTFYGQLMTAGDIYTIAGTGQGTESGDGGPATQAVLGQPIGLGFDGAGNLFVADESGRIREISG